jgi:hypothetical protein
MTAWSPEPTGVGRQPSIERDPARIQAPRLPSAIGSDRDMVMGTHVDKLGTGGLGARA